MRILKLTYLAILFLSWYIIDNNWITENHLLFDLRYSSVDKKEIGEYVHFIDIGILKVQAFFNSSFPKKFNIAIHPNRQSLDSTWQKDWGLPTFKSECWMVASGTAYKLDLLSPKVWNNEACEHNYSDLEKTQELITHELIHVFHGQFNASPNFDNIEGLDWLVEGLATYASGQCDSLRLSEVKRAIVQNKIPKNLDTFWSGNLKYGLSGSMVMFIDKKFGREKLKKLLPLTKKAEVLTELNIDEKTLLIEWKGYYS